MNESVGEGQPSLLGESNACVCALKYEWASVLETNGFLDSDVTEYMSPQQLRLMGAPLLLLGLLFSKPTNSSYVEWLQSTDYISHIHTTSALLLHSVSFEEWKYKVLNLDFCIIVKSVSPLHLELIVHFYMKPCLGLVIFISLYPVKCSTPTPETITAVITQSSSANSLDHLWYKSHLEWRACNHFPQ